jgi:hypothetical protein
MNNTKSWLNGPYNPNNICHTISVEKEIPQNNKVEKQQKVYINILHKEPWNTGPFYNKSTKCYKQDSDFKFANLEGTLFFRDYRIKK